VSTSYIKPAPKKKGGEPILRSRGRVALCPFQPAGRPGEGKEGKRKQLYPEKRRLAPFESGCFPTRHWEERRGGREGKTQLPGIVWGGGGATGPRLPFYLLIVAKKKEKEEGKKASPRMFRIMSWGTKRRRRKQIFLQNPTEGGPPEGGEEGTGRLRGCRVCRELRKGAPHFFLRYAVEVRGAGEGGERKKEDYYPRRSRFRMGPEARIVLSVTEIGRRGKKDPTVFSDGGGKQGKAPTIFPITHAP